MACWYTILQKELFSLLALRMSAVHAGAVSPSTSWERTGQQREGPHRSQKKSRQSRWRGRSTRCARAMVAAKPGSRQAVMRAHPAWRVLPRWHKDKGLAAFAANPLIFLVRLAGFEPTTPWFVAKYSIQLSYSRITTIIARNPTFSAIRTTIICCAGNRRNRWRCRRYRRPRPGRGCQCRSPETWR